MRVFGSWRRLFPSHTAACSSSALITVCSRHIHGANYSSVGFRYITYVECLFWWASVPKVTSRNVQPSCGCLGMPRSFARPPALVSGSVGLLQPAINHTCLWLRWLLREICRCLVSCLPPWRTTHSHHVRANRFMVVFRLGRGDRVTLACHCVP